jgi:hypothetical protein
MQNEDEAEALQFVCDAYRHLVCLPYTVANLHQMAVELGIHRGWFHGGKYPHYDIPKRRIKEIMAKCRVVESRAILAIILKYEAPLGRSSSYSVEGENPGSD